MIRLFYDIDEGITKGNLILLQEEDLIGIGFKTGARRTILDWFSKQRTQNLSYSPLLSSSGPPLPFSRSETTLQDSQHYLSNSNRSSPLSRFGSNQALPVSSSSSYSSQSSSFAVFYQPMLSNILASLSNTPVASTSGHTITQVS